MTRCAVADRPAARIAAVVDLEEANALAHAIPTTNPAAKTGALKLVLQALERLTEWQRYVGVLPAKLAPEIEVRAVASTIMDLFEQYGVGADTQDAIMKALQSGSAEPNGLPPAE